MGGCRLRSASAITCMNSTKSENVALDIQGRNGCCMINRCQHCRRQAARPSRHLPDLAPDAAPRYQSSSLLQTPNAMWGVFCQRMRQAAVGMPVSTQAALQAAFARPQHRRSSQTAIQIGRTANCIIKHLSRCAAAPRPPSWNRAAPAARQSSRTT